MFLIIDDYAKDGRQGEVWLLCSFYHEPLQTWIETNVNEFAISNHAPLKLAVQAVRSYSSLICEYELYILPNKKVSTAQDHGETYMKDRPPLVRHLLRNCLTYFLECVKIILECLKLSRPRLWPLSRPYCFQSMFLYSVFDRVLYHSNWPIRLLDFIQPCSNSVIAFIVPNGHIWHMN